VRLSLESNVARQKRFQKIWRKKAEKVQEKVSLHTLVISRSTLRVAASHRQCLRRKGVFLVG
jgi:hypothetical protein